MSLIFKPAWELPLPALADLFTRAFDGYVAGSVTMTPSMLSSMIAQAGIDLNLSMVAYRHDQPVGFGLIARQGWTSRIAAMGIAPDAQGQRVGDALLTHLKDQSRERGERAIELEAFEQNTRAVRLYEKHGFRSLRRLMSYAVDNPQGTESPGLTLIDIAVAARGVSAHSVIDLPWQASGSHLIRMATPFVAYQLGDALAILGDPASATIAVRAVLVLPDARGHGQGRRLLSALWAAFPDRKWFVPALCPEEFGAFFERCGFVKQALHQLQMRLDLTSAPN